MVYNYNEWLNDMIKVQEVIDYMGILSSSDKEHADNYKMAIAALLKQIPTFVKERPWTISGCPCCGERLGEYSCDGDVKNYSYMCMCPYCGQLLAWESNFPDATTMSDRRK